MITLYTQSSNQFLFKFIESHVPNAAQTAFKMEQLIFTDSASAIVKARLFAEELLKEVFKVEEIDTTYISSFYDKIVYLSSNEIILKNIQHSFDAIRRSGNKAAHDSTYDDLVAALQLHKEMYKIAVWFYETYTSDQQKIPGYNQPKAPAAPGPEDIKNMFDSYMKENFKEGFSQSEELEALAGKVEIEGNQTVVERDEQEEVSNEPMESQIPLITQSNVGGQQRSLLQEISRLKDSAKEAIENANEFSGFKEYLHIDRKIQLEIEEVLKDQQTATSANLILLCGSVGDGKSHLLAYLKKKHPEIMNNYYIHNDATESFSPGKDAMDTLEELLLPFSDNHIENTTQKTILAINLGVLHNFIYHDHKTAAFTKLKRFVEESDLFSQSIVTNYEVSPFSLFNFTDYHSFELAEEGAVSNFYQAILYKVFSEGLDNPFYQAYKRDIANQNRTMLHENYEFLQNEFVQKQVISLVVQSIVRNKLVISTRAFLNFIADILISDNLDKVNKLTNFEKLQQATPNLLFQSVDRSLILKSISMLDPIHKRTATTDNLIVQLNTLNDWKSINDYYLKDSMTKNWLAPFESNTELAPSLFSEYFESFVRMVYLTNSDFAKTLKDDSYESYMKSLYYFNMGDKKEIRNFYEEFKDIIFHWKGSLKRDYILLSHPFDKYKLGQKLSVKPVALFSTEQNESVLETFKSTITVGYKNENSSEQASLDIDYPLYELLWKVSKGYRPTKGDEDEAIKFTEFIDKIMQFGDKKEELLINFPSENKFYKIKRDDFDSLVFERE